MANETNTTVESELTFEESVEIIKKHKKKSIIAITVDSIIGVGLIAGTIAGIATGHYKTAAITGTLRLTRFLRLQKKVIRRRTNMPNPIKISIWTNGGGRIYKEIPWNEENINTATHFLEEYEHYVNHFRENPPSMSITVFPNMIVNLKEIAGVEVEGI